MRRAPLALAAAALAAVAVTGCGGGGDTPPPAGAGAADAGDPLAPGMGNGGYDVASYDIAVRWRPGEGLVATTRIAARATQRLARLNLDLLGLDVASVRVDGRAAQTRRDGMELVVTPAAPVAAGARFRVEVRYSGTPTPPFARGGWIERDGEVAVIGEPESAATWFPSNDHPSDKAAFTVRVTVPRGLHAASNGRLVSRADGPGTTTFTYRQPHPQATYLTTLHMGRLAVRPQMRSADGVPVRDVVSARADLGGPALSALREQPRMVDVFSALLGPYPFDVYGAAVTAVTGLALETQTLSVIGEAPLREAGEEVVAHELAHQWTGNDVTVSGWRDVWLNEGWATYLAEMWRAYRDPGHRWTAWARTVLDDHGDALDAPPGDPGGDLFSASVYFRGALTIHALRLELGEAGFARLMREHAARFGGGNVSTEEFTALAEEIAGRDLSPLFDAWLRAQGLPGRLGGLDLRTGEGSAEPGGVGPGLAGAARCLRAAGFAAASPPPRLIEDVLRSADVHRRGGPAAVRRCLAAA